MGARSRRPSASLTWRDRQTYLDHDLATLERDPQELYLNSEERLGVSSPMKGKARSLAARSNTRQKTPRHIFLLQACGSESEAKLLQKADV